MKRIIWIPIILILILGIIIIIVLQSKKEVKISNMKELSLFYTVGYYANADIRYELKCSDKCIVTFKDQGKEAKEAIKYEIPKEKVKELEEVFEKYQVSSWDGFNKSDNGVLDGNSFGFYLVMEDGTKISANGYMRYPKNYGKVKEKIEELLKKE